MYLNLNQLQWKLKRETLYSCDPKTCLDVLKTQFKEFFDSQEFLDVLEKITDERVLKYRELQMKEREVQAIQDIKKWLKEREIHQQESLVIEGTTLEANLSTDGTTSDASSVIDGPALEACLVTKGIAMDDNFVARESIHDFVTSLEQLDESISLGNDANVEKILVDTVDSDIEKADIRPSYDSDTVSDVHHDTFEYMFAHEIQTHEQPESIPNTYVVNENNTESTHDQTDDELTNKELKQMEADDQVIHTILMGLPEDIYAVVDSCETTYEIWLRVEQMMKVSSIGVQEKKVKLFNEWERFTSTKGELIESYYHYQPYPLPYMQQPQPNNNYILQPSFNTNDMQQPMPNPKDIYDLTTVMNMELVRMAKAFKLNYSTPTNNNQRTSSNPRNRQIAHPDMNMGQIARNQNGYNAVQNVKNQVVQNAVQNLDVQNVRNHNGLIVVLGIANQNVNQTWNGNVVVTRAGVNGYGNNGDHIRCYKYRGMGHLARNCTLRPRRRDAAYLQTQLLIAQKEEAGI
ncbi:hypothetical protein Tco_1555561 [Tanacetum coccineum]